MQRFDTKEVEWLKRVAKLLVAVAESDYTGHTEFRDEQLVLVHRRHLCKEAHELDETLPSTLYPKETT